MTTPIRLDEASAGIPTLKNQSQHTLEMVAECMNSLLEKIDDFLDDQKENIPSKEYGLMRAISKDLHCIAVLASEGEDAYYKYKLRSLTETMLDTLIDPLEELKAKLKPLKKEKPKKFDKETIDCKTQ
jgi:hypothetical protein